MQTLKIFSKTAEHNSEIFYPNSPYVCVIKVCSSGGAICIIGRNIRRYSLETESSISEH